MDGEWHADPNRAAFERRRVVIAPGAEYQTYAGAWADALVMLKSGRVELECRAGARGQFQAGAVLCLAWLPLTAVRNTSNEPAVLTAIRRRRTLPAQSGR